MGLGKTYGTIAVVGCAIITAVNMYHGGEPLPIVAWLAVIGLIEYVALK